MEVHYPKLHNMVHLLALNDLLLPKDITTRGKQKVRGLCYLIKSTDAIYLK